MRSNDFESNLQEANIWAYPYVFVFFFVSMCIGLFVASEGIFDWIWSELSLSCIVLFFVWFCLTSYDSCNEKNLIYYLNDYYVLEALHVNISWVLNNHTWYWCSNWDGM